MLCLSLAAKVIKMHKQPLMLASASPCGESGVHLVTVCKLSFSPSNDSLVVDFPNSLSIRRLHGISTSMIRSRYKLSNV